LQTSNTLDLDTLQNGLPGISPTWGRFLAEASAVCLHHHNHVNGVHLRVTGSFQASLEMHWTIIIDDQVLRSWADELELTEYGACGVAILAILKLAGFKVIRRARRGSRVDYWLAKANDDPPFQEAARLEVSGILAGDQAELSKRTREKITQTQRSSNALPAYVVVVEFSAPQSHMVQA
jgi:hypothetical protein